MGENVNKRPSAEALGFFKLQGQKTMETRLLRSERGVTELPTSVLATIARLPQGKTAAAG